MEYSISFRAKNLFRESMRRSSSPILAAARLTFRTLPPPNPAKWKRHQLKLLIERVRKDRSLFLALRSLDAGTKREIYPVVRRTLNRLHSAQTLSTREQAVYMFLVLVLIGIPEIWLLDRVIKATASLEINGWLFVLGVFFSYALIFYFPRTESKGVAMRWLSVYPLIVLGFGILASPSRSSQVNNSWFGPVYSLSAGAAATSMFVILIIVGATPVLFLIARRLRSHTDAQILKATIVLIQETESNARSWEALRFRARLTKDVDKLSNLIENVLPSAYSGTDELFRGWITPRTLDMAIYVRDLKKWLAIPNEDTRIYFLQALTRIVNCLGRGDWNGFPTALTAAENRHARRAATLLAGIRTLLASALPITALLLLHLRHHDPPSPAAGYLYLGASAWLVVGSISLLDPLYSTRLEAFKSALEYLPGVKKG